MKRYIAICLLMLFTVPAMASFTEDRGKDHIVAWWVAQGNTGPIPEDGFMLGFNKAGEQVITKWIVADMGAAKPSYANLNSRSATSAAVRVKYERKNGPDAVTQNKRLKRAFKGILKYINILLAKHGDPPITMEEMLDLD